MSRQTRTDRRRAMLARRCEALEALEPKAMITESLGLMALGVGVPVAAVAAREAGHARAAVRTGGHARKPLASHPVLPIQATPVIAARRHRDQGGFAHVRRPEADRPRPTAEAGDWLTLFRHKADPEQAAATRLSAPKPAKPASGGGAAQASRGGSAGNVPGLITPLRLPPPPQAAGSGNGALGAAVGGNPATARPSGPVAGRPTITFTPPTAGAPATASFPGSSAPSSSSGGGGKNPGITARPDPGLFSVPGGRLGLSQGSF
jgi:hypothetical protein